MPRRASKPIPERVLNEFYLAVWDLAWSGKCYRSVPPSEFDAGKPFFQQFGIGSNVSRRHGLVVLWSTACALRFSELRRLRVIDVDTQACTVFVSRAKGSNDETLRVEPMLIECTIAWHRRVQIKSHLLLPNEHGKPLNNKVFNRDVAKPLGSMFGIEISHHSFRDTACGIGFANGNDARAVQRFLGHKSAKTTEIYAKKSAPLPMQIPLFAGGAQ